ncbi:hypothetical protein FQN54_001260 [Arachnomyces sp. PD_36]|nr:hypothetical protein FQN54_001260 [Arachnomyces sp. PD_36]
MRGVSLLFPAVAVGAAALNSRAGEPLPLEDCPGYAASHIVEDGDTLSADLHLAGAPCNTYGKDIEHLKLKVEYESENRLHVNIYDADELVYQVPESVFPRPGSNGKGSKAVSQIRFEFEANPFSFAVIRDGADEPLFDTAGSPLIFQSQYLNLRTSLPEDPNIYGLGESTDAFKLNTTDYTRTLWNRDAYGTPPGTNLYGAHPLYLDHRLEGGDHGVFLLNSNGMDIKMDKSDAGENYLEYNALGGVFDLYFLAGSSPRDVTGQYAEIAGLPAMMPYWGFGFHQCRYGYRDAFEVAEVVYNYSQAGIPLETMWTDIDYMDRRKVFTLDSERFPLETVQDLVTYLHDHDQHYIVMVDPAVSTTENEAFGRGVEDGIFMKHDNGTLYKGAVWAGTSVFPDWFHEDTQDYWTNEFALFFDAEDGVDIDALWIDMNEASNFCEWPCLDPDQHSIDNDLPPDAPPVRDPPRPIPGFPDAFQPSGKRSVQKRSSGDKMGLPGRDLIDPPYTIANEAGSLSNKTMNTDLSHANGLVQYDTHNLYGSLMSKASQQAMLARRPTQRPLIITRSTFAGAGATVGHWLGDNMSEWEQYRFSIAQMLNFGSLFQMPMVGTDVCGFAGNTTEGLCARWASLGAFYPFYRNHNDLTGIPQEFYRWASVSESARNAIEVRYKLLDYIYTAFYRQTKTGEPLLNPMFYLYPSDANTVAIDLQFFYGDSILVTPVTDEDSTSVTIYLPDDLFYDYYTGSAVQGSGEEITLDNVALTEIPLHIRGGSIIPERSESAMTTAELRTKDFNLIIAPDANGEAKGSLYLDDGISIEQDATSEIEFKYSEGKLSVEGKFDYDAGVGVSSITLLNYRGDAKTISVSSGEKDVEFEYDAEKKTLKTQSGFPLTGPIQVTFSS